METLLRDTNLIKRAFWLVRLRWGATAVLGTAVLVANRILHLPLPVIELGVIAGVIVLYNFALFILLRHMTSILTEIFRSWDVLDNESVSSFDL